MSLGWAEFDFFWLVNKWVGLGWLTKRSTRGGSSRIESDYTFWQLYRNPSNLQKSQRGRG